jgi:hypothetical protein
MTATVISNTPPFGAMTNQAVATLYALNLTITRLQAAVGSAAAGYTGTAGTEYETNATNFGVVASGTPGQKGSDYAFAVGTLGAAWNTFWTAASGALQALDNGVVT